MIIVRGEYPSYETREKVKLEGWQKIANASSVREKAFYYLQHIIWSHYWRAREAIESASKPQFLLRKIRGRKYYLYYELDIDHYTNHWLHAFKDIIPMEVVNIIEEEWGYKPQENKYLPKGYSLYQIDGLE